MEEKDKLTNPYKQGADDGFLFALYLTGLFFASAFALEVPGLGILSTCLIIAVPFIIFVAIRRTWQRDGGMSTFSALWMQGIMTFLCGGLLSGVIAFAYLKWINPGWLAEQVRAMADIYAQIDGGAIVADTLEKMLERGLLPSSIQMVFQMLWLEIFTGSVLSLIVTAIVRIRKPRTRKQNVHG